MGLILNLVIVACMNIIYKHFCAMLFQESFEYRPRSGLAQSCVISNFHLFEELPH